MDRTERRWGFNVLECLPHDKAARGGRAVARIITRSLYTIAFQSGFFRALASREGKPVIPRNVGKCLGILYVVVFMFGAWGSVVVKVARY